MCNHNSAKSKMHSNYAFIFALITAIIYGIKRDWVLKKDLKMFLVLKTETLQYVAWIFSSILILNQTNYRNKSNIIRKFEEMVIVNKKTRKFEEMVIVNKKFKWQIMLHQVPEIIHSRLNREVYFFGCTLYKLFSLSICYLAIVV